MGSDSRGRRRRPAAALAARGGVRTAPAVLAIAAAFVTVATLASQTRPARADEARALDVVEIVTGGADPASELPLIIAVHGLGDRPASFARLFDELGVQARIALPRAPIPWGPGFSWFPLPGADAESQERFVGGLRDAAGVLAGLAGELARDRPTEGLPVITGFSQGGMLAFAVAALHPGAIRASVPIAGLLPEAITPSTEAVTKPRVMAYHGGADRRVPAARAELAVERLRSAGYSAEIHRYAGVGHTVTPAMRRDVLASIAAAVSGSAAATTVVPSAKTPPAAVQAAP